ncbi:MAG: peptidoglycan DD-metalloendopeptidase family protein [Litoreibacter sp.]|nr:peptidoglycan DD-metalloendopeptidase family protein [Litoreibacter sp.]
MKLYRHLLIAGLIACLGLPALGQSDPITTARRASQMLVKASNALDQARKSTDRVSALTKTVRAYEEGLTAMREGIRVVSIRERAIRLSFEEELDRLSRLVGALQTIGRSPAPLWTMHPSGPLGAARSALIISDVTPALARDAAVLRAQLEELSILRVLQEEAAASLTQALSGVQQARADLSKAIADRTDLPRRFISDTEQISALVQNSDTLSGFADSLLTLETGAMPARESFQKVKGKLRMPTEGRLLHAFNEPDAAGIARPGLLWATSAQSLVMAPWTATIRYAGPLLSYGNVIILEPESGFLLILGGMGQTFGEIGELVEEGAPLGLMSGTLQDIDAFLMNAAKGSSGNRQESLYIELRQDGEALDPSSWFDLNRD